VNPKQKTGGNRFLLISIFLLFLVTICLFFGIAFSSIPTRTAELYGPPDPALSPVKVFPQSIILLLSNNQLLEPGNQASGDVLFSIEPGESLESILAELTSLGYIQGGSAVRAYLIYKGTDTRIQPGQYPLSPEMSELEIADQLDNPVPTQTTVSILAGWRVEEIGESLVNLGLNITADDLIQTVQAGGKEGYLFPGNYQVEREITANQLVDLFFERFLSQITPEMETNIKDQGLTLQQAVILASIIEREAVLEEEMPEIASVFLNRLRQNLNLAADPTVQYALGYNQIQETWWKNPLSLDDLHYPSPYNTYDNPGLPPGPICNPGLAAIQAVAQPADTDYLYFRAACDGSGTHLFSETFETHLENACP